MSLYWHYDAPAYSYGSYTAMPSIYASPAFQWGYAAAANQATRIPKRHRRALSVPLEGGATPTTGTQTSYTQYGGHYGYPLVGRATADAIKMTSLAPMNYSFRGNRSSRLMRKIERLEDEDESPLAPPVSFSSLRSRLLVAADMNDASKRLYERYIPGVDDVSLPSYKKV